MNGKSMATELLFESRSVNYLLRQQGANEDDPVILIRLELSSAPKIYAADLSLINASAWRLKILPLKTTELAAAPSGWVSYSVIDGKQNCLIELYQSAERYRALLEMFKGGHVSEIAAVIDDLANNSDYSRTWDTIVQPRLPLNSICFEFSLPQSEA
jgi:hypothetical protein